MYESVPIDHDLRADERGLAPVPAALARWRQLPDAPDCPVLGPSSSPNQPVPVPVTCWPTVRLTEATVPAMVERQRGVVEGGLRLESEDSAEVTDAWSESIWVCAGARGLVARRGGLGRIASWACAAVDVLRRGRSCRPWPAPGPAVTVWPALTFTAVTVPDTAKFRLAWLAGSIVPELATVC